MYFSDSWSFLVELKAFPGEVPETVGIVPVDLSEEDDRGDIEPSKDVVSGELRCLVGKDDEKVGDERRYVARVWEYREDDSFNGKFTMFRPVALADFVRRLLDANMEFDGFTEDDVARLKKALLEPSDASMALEEGSYLEIDRDEGHEIYEVEYDDDEMEVWENHRPPYERR